MPSNAATTLTVDVEARVEITVQDPVVLSRYITDHSEEPPYGYLVDRESVLGHLAYNAVSNGVQRINQLDGWADLDDDAATFRVHDVETIGEL